MYQIRSLPFYVNIIKNKLLLPRQKVINQLLLIPDAVALRLISVLPGKADVGGGVENFCIFFHEWSVLLSSVCSGRVICVRMMRLNNSSAVIFPRNSLSMV